MEITTVNGQLVIKATLSSGVPSKSGKSTILATTNGFIPVAGQPDIKVSLNVIKMHS